MQPLGPLMQRVVVELQAMRKERGGAPKRRAPRQSGPGGRPDLRNVVSLSAERRRRGLVR